MCYQGFLSHLAPQIPPALVQGTWGGGAFYFTGGHLFFSGSRDLKRRQLSHPPPCDPAHSIAGPDVPQPTAPGPLLDLVTRHSTGGFGTGPAPRACSTVAPGMPGPTPGLVKRHAHNCATRHAGPGPTPSIVKRRAGPCEALVTRRALRCVARRPGPSAA